MTEAVRACRSRPSCRPEKVYDLDAFYTAQDSPSVVFAKEVEPIISRAVAGFNATVFAYGPTGSGKTYLMQVSSGSRSSFCRPLSSYDRCSVRGQGSLPSSKGQDMVPCEAAAALTISCSFCSRRATTKKKASFRKRRRGSSQGSTPSRPRWPTTSSTATRWWTSTREPG